MDRPVNSESSGGWLGGSLATAGSPLGVVAFLDRGLLVGAVRAARRGQAALERVHQALARLGLPEPFADGGVGPEVLFPVRDAALLGQIAELLLIGVEGPARLGVFLGGAPDVVVVGGVTRARRARAARGGVRRALRARRERAAKRDQQNRQQQEQAYRMPAARSQSSCHGTLLEVTVPQELYRLSRGRAIARGITYSLCVPSPARTSAFATRRASTGGARAIPRSESARRRARS